MKKLRIAYIVWKQYQRRSELLAQRLDANIKFMPHLFKAKYIRPLDYLLKLISTFKYIIQHQPDIVIVQAPPLFGAIAPMLMRVPYVIDAHNATIQGFWLKFPSTEYLLNRSSAILVHNNEIFHIAKSLIAHNKIVSILDPLEVIIKQNKQRLNNQVLVICSFSSDEPIDIIIETIRRLPDYTFVITADISKLCPLQRQLLHEQRNVCLTGFLPTEEYQSLLVSSLAALVLTTRDSTQPSGACEALSSDTQLIISETSLTKELFADWAILVDNSVESIVSAIQSLELKAIDLSNYRNLWEISVNQGIDQLYSLLYSSNRL
ncbi:hypothetical protein JYQ62_29140 [Nostoc sp. UHCC 0702]|nr:hypothetical protein JYQ62_29140 [Nostoc sp. UHCC 0702]